MNAGTIPTMALAVANGHAVFLDCAADRYFALSPDENEAVLRLLAGETISRRAERALTAATGIEASTGQFRSLLAPADAIALVQSPVVNMRSGWVAGLLAIRHLIGTRAMLKTKGLHASLQRLARVGAASCATARPAGRRDRIVAAHDWLSRHSTANDACLVRSLALACHLRSSGCAAQLMIAVRTDPFAAHCWVQSGDQVLNEDLDAIKAFEPILVVR